MSMEDKLVTLAIHTFEKAQMLKMILESEGIEVYIHNVNQIQPVISAGVRVRIKESDLPHALRIIEDSKWLESPAEAEKEIADKGKRILVPVDFSDYSLKACEIAIHYAAKVDAEVMIMHAYFSPYFHRLFLWAIRWPIRQTKRVHARCLNGYKQTWERSVRRLIR